MEKPDYRGIKKDTLLLYRVGVGKEKFRNDQEQLAWFDAIYFPLYAPKSKKTLQKEREDPSSVSQEAEIMNNSEYEIVKMKVRGVG